MADQPDYRDEKIATLLVNPLLVTLQGTFSDSGATCTVTSSGSGQRVSHPGATITGDTGDYDVAGLPKGGIYHVVGCNLLPADGTAATCVATVQAGSLDASAGTLTLQTRDSSDGSEADPADDDELHLTLLLEPATYV